MMYKHTTVHNPFTLNPITYEYRLLQIPGGDTTTDEDAEIMGKINKLASEGFRLLPISMTGGLGIMEKKRCLPVEVA